MQKIVPQKVKFDDAEKWNLRKRWLVSLTVGLSIFAEALGHDFFVSCPYIALLQNMLSKVIFLCSLLALLFSVFFTITYRQAEKLRRDAYFDNSFECKLGDQPSVGYFSNDSIPVGMKRSLANLFENCFFSVSIIGKVFNKSLYQLLIIVFTLIVCGVFNVTKNNILIFIANIILSLCLIEEVFELHFLKKNLEKVCENCKSILSTYFDTAVVTSDKVNGLIIRELIRYETALSYASILFDSKYFKEINVSKSEEWEKIKIRYKLD